MMEGFVDLEADVVKFAPKVYRERCNSHVEFLRKYMDKNKHEYTIGYMGYLFQCLHCQKYRLYMDMC